MWSTGMWNRIFRVLSPSLTQVNDCLCHWFVCVCVFHMCSSAIACDCCERVQKPWGDIHRAQLSRLLRETEKETRSGGMELFSGSYSGAIKVSDISESTLSVAECGALAHRVQHVLFYDTEERDRESRRTSKNTPSSWETVSMAAVTVATVRLHVKRWLSWHP